MRFVFDIDNVVYNSIETCISAYIDNRITDVEDIKIPSSDDCYQFNMKDIMPDLGDNELQYIFDGDFFFENIILIEGMTELINSLHDKGHEIIFATFGLTKNVCKKLVDLRRRFPFCKITPIVADWGDSLSKDFFNMNSQPTIFIDDQTKYLNDSNAAHCIMFSQFAENSYDREWNKNWGGLKANSINNLEWVVAMILETEK